MQKKRKQPDQNVQEPILPADKRLFPKNRRAFLKTSSLGTLGAIIATPFAFSHTAFLRVLKSSMITLPNVNIPGKDPGLTMLDDIPLNIETPAHMLDDALTPNTKFFIRNNGIEPPVASLDPSTWTLTIDGEAVSKPRTFTLQELKTKFKHHTYQLTLECAGNGRKEYQPPTDGSQWTIGGVGCAAYTGVRLADVLHEVGIESNAVYIGYYGADTHVDGIDAEPISRGVPIAKALEPESLLAWATQDGDLHYQNGYPLRLVFGGWPASCSGKWLQRIAIRDRVHDGAKMNGMYYRMPQHPVAPGSEVPEEMMEIIEALPVKSLITYPRSGTEIQFGVTLDVRGHAWVGDKAIRAVAVSIDFGATWIECTVDAPANKNAWQHFRTQVRFPEPGYFEIWSKATDEDGISQPLLVPGWNPEGYLNNSCHNIIVTVK